MKKLLLSTVSLNKKKDNKRDEKIKVFIECLIPSTTCNMNCHYCYVAQRGQNKTEISQLPFSSQLIGESLSNKRLGGNAFISICGAGETLLTKELPEILFYLLKQGHYLNVTTNGTITNGFNNIINLIPINLMPHIHFSFSFHYLELLRLDKIDLFFKNINRIKKSGCSFIVQVNLCDEYEPFIEDIKKIIKENTGAYPQIAATRDEKSNRKDIRLFTRHTEEEYNRIGEEFDSPLFRYTIKNFMVKRKEYCYAGAWSFVLNLSTGILRPCYGSNITQNIFSNVKTKIKKVTIGKHCPSTFCMNSSHFIALGVIPELDHPTYAELRARQIDNKDTCWYSDNMLRILNQDLAVNNQQYSSMKQLSSEIFYLWGDSFGKYKKLISRIFRKDLFTILPNRIIKHIKPVTLRYEILYMMSKNKIIDNKQTGKFKIIYLFLAADYGNLGDVAITIAQSKIIKKIFPEYRLVEIPMTDTIEALKSISKRCKPQDIITIIGGGNMGDSYYEFEIFREMVVKKLRKNRIISFPQTMDFSSTRKGKNALSLAKRIYSSHSNLTILARERKSFLQMKKNFPDNKIYLVPDIVLTLNCLKTEVNRNGLLMCMRNDKERFITETGFDEIYTFAKQSFNSITYADTHIGGNFLSNVKRNQEFENIIDTFLGAELVFTDRLHGMIFCYITGTPAIVFPNSNFKIEESYNWIKDCHFIEFARETNAAYLKKLVNSVLNATINIELFENRKRYFENLIIESFN